MSRFDLEQLPEEEWPSDYALLVTEILTIKIENAGQDELVTIGAPSADVARDDVGARQAVLGACADAASSVQAYVFEEEFAPAVGRAMDLHYMYRQALMPVWELAL